MLTHTRVQAFSSFISKALLWEASSLRRLQVWNRGRVIRETAIQPNCIPKFNPTTQICQHNPEQLHILQLTLITRGKQNRPHRPRNVIKRHGISISVDGGENFNREEAHRHIR